MIAELTVYSCLYGFENRILTSDCLQQLPVISLATNKKPLRQGKATAHFNPPLSVLLHHTGGRARVCVDRSGHDCLSRAWHGLCRSGQYLGRISRYLVRNGPWRGCKG
jgi:hypothetical protein